jgi:hypothetical protein
MPARPSDPLDLTPEERHQAVVRLFAAVLLRLSQRRLSAPENPAESAPSPTPENLEDSGVSVLACGRRKSVHVQRS